jgi:hypothetical protein
VSDYLGSIHPVSWTVLGNFKQSDAEEIWYRERWLVTSSYGEPLPLCGVRTTSSVEGENHAYIWASVRSSLPPVAMEAFCSRVIEVLARKVTNGARWRLDGYNVTPTAKALFDTELGLVPFQSARSQTEDKFSITEQIVRDRENSTSIWSRTFSVKMAQRTCQRCKTREHLLIPCRHVLAAIHYSATVMRRAKPDVAALFDPAYLVSTYDKKFRDMQVNMPMESDLTVEDVIKNPPLYRQAGSRTRIRSSADTAKRPKRVLNSGEGRSMSTSYPERVSLTETFSALGTTSTECEITAFFCSDVRGRAPTKRKPYCCSSCGMIGHNVARCLSQGNDHEQAGHPIVPGAYVVGDSPFEACGVAHLYNS